MLRSSVLIAHIIVSRNNITSYSVPISIVDGYSNPFPQDGNGGQRILGGGEWRTQAAQVLGMTDSGRSSRNLNRIDASFRPLQAHLASCSAGQLAWLVGNHDVVMSAIHTDCTLKFVQRETIVACMLLSTVRRRPRGRAFFGLLRPSSALTHA